MNWFLRLLKTFDYHCFQDLVNSLAPSCKYGVTLGFISLSGIASVVSNIFGLDVGAFVAFLLVMGVELATGLYASHVQGIEFSSQRFSRFLFKLFYYVALIGISYLMAVSFEKRGKGFAAGIFEWLHIFLVVQIVCENVMSILENAAVIEGKPKAHYVTMIKEFISKKLS